MKEAAARMNLGPGAHYNPVTGTFVRTSTVDPYRMMYKSNIGPIVRSNTFFTNKILANSPILDLSTLRGIKDPSSRTKYLCRKLE